MWFQVQHVGFILDAHALCCQPQGGPPQPTQRLPPALQPKYRPSAKQQAAAAAALAAGKSVTEAGTMTDASPKTPQKRRLPEINKSVQKNVANAQQDAERLLDSAPLRRAGGSGASAAAGNTLETGSSWRSDGPAPLWRVGSGGSGASIAASATSKGSRKSAGENKEQTMLSAPQGAVFPKERLAATAAAATAAPSPSTPQRPPMAVASAQVRKQQTNANPIISSCV